MSSLSIRIRAPKSFWLVPGAAHTGGIEARPQDLAMLGSGLLLGDD